MLTVPFKLSAGHIHPPQSSYHSPGIDLHAAEYVIIEPGETLVVPLGIAFAIPAGYVGILKDRSSMAKRGLHISGGVIDPDYRGEVSVVMTNHTTRAQSLRIGDRVVQMLILPAPHVELVETGSLGETTRGERGFGSSGQ